MDGNCCLTVTTNQRDITFDGNYIWISSGYATDTCGAGYVGTLHKINPSNNATEYTIDITNGLPETIGFFGGSLWVVRNQAACYNVSDQGVLKIDPSLNPLDGDPVEVFLTQGTENEMYFSGTGSTNISYDGQNIWVSDRANARIYKMDSVSKAFSFINFNPVASDNTILGLAFDGFNIWAIRQNTSNEGNVATKIDIDSNLSVADVIIGYNPWGIVFDGSYIWVSNLQSHSLTKIDIIMDAVVNSYGLNDTRTHQTSTKHDMNLHWYHLHHLSNFRGTGSPLLTSGQCDSGILDCNETCDNCHRNPTFNQDIYPTSGCVNCHNVHGSNTAYGSVYDEIGYTNVSGTWGTYGQMKDEAYQLESVDTNPGFLDKYPTYCAYSCHNHTFRGLDLGKSRAWFDSITE